MAWSPASAGPAPTRSPPARSRWRALGLVPGWLDRTSPSPRTDRHPAQLDRRPHRARCLPYCRMVLDQASEAGMPGVAGPLGPLRRRRHREELADLLVVGTLHEAGDLVADAGASGLGEGDQAVVTALHERLLSLGQDGVAHRGGAARVVEVVVGGLRGVEEVDLEHLDIVRGGAVHDLQAGDRLVRGETGAVQALAGLQVVDVDLA